MGLEENGNKFGAPVYVPLKGSAFLIVRCQEGEEIGLFLLGFFAF